jgi:hypothetical protein
VKKIFFLAIILLLGYTGVSYAVQAEIPADSTAAVAKSSTQVTIGGEVRFRFTNYQNINDFNRHVTTPGTNYLGGSERMVGETRIRLGVEAKVSPNTVGFLMLESGGASGAAENTFWGSGGVKKNGGSFRFGDTKGDAFRVLQAWIQHSGSGLLGVPAYIKIGHQPIVIGNGVFYRHNYLNDDAIVLGVSPLKGLDITALTVKLQENGDLAADDQDLYSAIITYAFNKDISLGADVSFLDSQRGTVIPNGWSHLWNVGFNAKAKFGDFMLKGELDFQTGGDNWPGAQWDYNGYAAMLGVSYKFAPAVISLEFGYTSGDNKNDNKVSTFLTSQGHAPYMTLVYEHLTSNAAGNFAGALQNTMILKLSGNVDVMKDLNIAPAISVLQAARRSFGAGTPSALVSNNGGTPTTSRNIGTEIDIVYTYKVDKGLTWYLETGYLFAGNYWKALTANGKVSDPWMTRMGLMLNF